MYEKRTDGTARDVLRLTRFETALCSGDTQQALAVLTLRWLHSLPFELAGSGANATDLEIEATIDS